MIASVAVKSVKVLPLVKLQLQVLRKLLQQLNIAENSRLAVIKLLFLNMMTNMSKVVIISLSILSISVTVIAVLIKNFLIKTHRLIVPVLQSSLIHITAFLIVTILDALKKPPPLQQLQLVLQQQLNVLKYQNAMVMRYLIIALKFLLVAWKDLQVFILKLLTLLS
jgi:hypothetical protein